MEFTEIKGSLFGYNKDSVRQYISELNEIKGTELAAEKARAEKAASMYEDKIKALDMAAEELRRKNSELEDKIAALESEMASVKNSHAELEAQHESLNNSYSELEEETRELRNKSDVISTAIINAEKCATTMINDADARAKEMIGEAEERVEDEVKRLDTARTYISEVREAVEVALRKIDNELGGIEADINGKKASVYSDDKKNVVREKFEMLFKKA